MRIIAGHWRGRRLNPLRGRDIRPTSDRVREAWMSAMGGSLDDIKVLDLFAGSGALGLETLSRGASEVVFVESAPSAIRVIRENIRMLGAEGACKVVPKDALLWVRNLPPLSFDLALADPPYKGECASRLLTLFAAAPFARALWVEHGSREEVPALPGLQQRRYGDTTLSTLTADV